MLLTSGYIGYLYFVVTVKFIKNFQVVILQETHSFLQLNKMRKKMNAKKLLVSFLLIASVLFLATASVSAAVTTAATVYVDGVKVSEDGSFDPLANTIASVIAGEKIEVKVRFTADEDAQD